MTKNNSYVVLDTQPVSYTSKSGKAVKGTRVYLAFATETGLNPCFWDKLKKCYMPRVFWLPSSLNADLSSMKSYEFELDWRNMCVLKVAKIEK